MFSMALNNEENCVVATWQVIAAGNGADNSLVLLGDGRIEVFDSGCSGGAAAGRHGVAGLE